MPIVRLYDIPEGLREHPALTELARVTIPQAVASVEELHIRPQHVRVVTAGDLIEDGTGEEMHATVLLTKKPDRTAHVVGRVAAVVAYALDQFVKEHVPQCMLVQVFPQLLDEMLTPSATVDRRSKT